MEMPMKVINFAHYLQHVNNVINHLIHSMRIC